MCTCKHAQYLVGPDDCCFGKSEIAHPTVKTPNDKDDVSDGNTVGGVVRSAGNTTTSEKVTKISSKTVDLNVTRFARRGLIRAPLQHTDFTTIL